MPSGFAVVLGYRLETRTEVRWKAEVRRKAEVHRKADHLGGRYAKKADDVLGLLCVVRSCEASAMALFAEHVLGKGEAL